MDNPIEDFAVHTDVSCNPTNVPSAVELVESLDALGTALLSVGSIILVFTIYFSADACRNIFSQKESEFYKTNAIILLLVYPVVSVCSLMAIAIPRGQLLSEAITQIFLTISLYRLYLLLLDVGRQKISETPILMLRVGPCCCWPCLPFPNLQMTDTNLSWIGILALQLPIVQSLLYFILLYMEAENSILALQYGTFLQPFMVISILLGIYSLTITTKTLHAAIPEVKLHYKTLVLQLVLLFSKLQSGIIRVLPSMGVFPCNPPLTPAIYANVTCNALLLIEMMMLCYAARHVYYVNLEKTQETDTTDRTSRNPPNQVDTTNSNDGNKQLPTTVMTA